MQDFKPPERKDRARDHHGGVMSYVKDSIHYKRKHYLEPLNLECIWVEIQLNHTRALFGLFTGLQILMRYIILPLKIFTVSTGHTN